MSTETTNKKIKIDNGTTFGRTYTDKAVDELLKNAGGGAITEFVLNDYLSTSDFTALAQAIYAKKDTILLFNLTSVINNVNTTFVKMIVNVGGEIQNFLFVRSDFGEYSGQGYACIFSFNSNDFETVELHLTGGLGYLDKIKLQVNTNILPLPADASTSTYVLKAVNGTVQWVKEA